jgi:hypothetical protein
MPRCPLCRSALVTITFSAGPADILTATGIVSGDDART